METTHLSAFIGDSTSLAIPLEWLGESFDPGEDWTLIFTAKKKPSDLDAAAIIQKGTGLGITSSAGLATVALVPDDTVDLKVCNLFCDVQAQHIDTGTVRTVAYARLELLRDITRDTEISIPVVTTEEPSPIAGAVRYDAAQTLTTGQKTQARENIGVECLTGAYSPLARQVITFTGLGEVGGIPTPDPSASNTGVVSNGKQKWTSTLGGLAVVVEHNGTAWEFKVQGFTYASKTSSADTPAGLTDWSLESGASQPTVTGGALVLATTGLATGLRYRQGSSAPYSWWDYNGTSWEPRTYSGRPVAWSPELGAYRALTVDSDLAPTSIAFPHL